MPVLAELRGVHDLPSIPPHTPVSSILREMMPSWNTNRRISVTDAARKHMKVNANGRWVDFDPNVTPYMVEPANMMTSRRYRELVFAGPARAGKTVFLLTGIAHSISSDPGAIRLVHIGENPARTWVDDELAGMIENSPDLSERIGTGVSDDTIFSKRFKGGTKLIITWPTVDRLSGYTARTMLLTDLDRMKLNIGEGTPFSLAAKRTETLGSRGMTAAESSPGHHITDADWTPRTPHEAPPCPGIMDLYNGGTRARLYWQCRDCGDEFAPSFARLNYNEELSPTEAGDDALMICPCCGVAFHHRHKAELNRWVLKDHGGWRHETHDGKVAAIDSDDIVRSQRLSYWLDGTAAAFSTWARLVEKFETAKKTFAELSDEGPLEVTVNTDQGSPYLPRALKEKRNLTLKELKDQLRDLPRGIAPNWTRFVVLSADVQKGRFVVQATAFGDGAERQIIDRFDVHEPPEDAPRAESRTIDPARYVEDWAALIPHLEKVYPLDGLSYGLRPMAMACDFHGEPGVSDRATKFWQGRRAAGEMSRWYMVRGHGGFKVLDRVWYKAPSRAANGAAARDIKLLNVATDRLKDSVYAATQRPDGGPGAMHVGAWMAEEHLVELTAEIRLSKGYDKRKGMVRNETIDLSVYALGLAEFKGLNRIDPAKPMPWARLGPSNEYAVSISSDGEAKPVPGKPKKKSAPRKIKFLE